MQSLVKTQGCPDADVLAGCVFRADSFQTLRDSYRKVQCAFLGQCLSGSAGNHSEQSACPTDW